MFENAKKVLINAVLAGFWAGLAALQVSGELSEASIWAAGAVALRAAIGFAAAYFKAPIIVDK